MKILEAKNLSKYYYKNKGFINKKSSNLRAVSNVNLELNLNESLKETWHVMRRAGAQYIITYGARLAKEMGF